MLLEGYLVQEVPLFIAFPSLFTLTIKKEAMGANILGSSMIRGGVGG